MRGVARSVDRITRIASDGIDVFPNLGYKKDTFLEPSLVRISLAFGRCPTIGRTGSGPYPRVDEVSEGSELVGDFHLNLS